MVSIYLKGEPILFRLWGKIITENHLDKDVVIKNDRADTRTHKIMNALEKICYDFDLGKPIWLDSNITDFKKHRKTRFRQDNFLESIPFDFLEIEIIEED